MIDEHRKVMGSHQISIRAADLLEDMRPQHYNGMNRAQPYSIVWVCWVYPVFNSHFNTPLEIRKWVLDFVNFL